MIEQSDEANALVSIAISMARIADRLDSMSVPLVLQPNHRAFVEGHVAMVEPRSDSSTGPYDMPLSDDFLARLRSY